MSFTTSEEGGGSLHMHLMVCLRYGAYGTSYREGFNQEIRYLGDSLQGKFPD